MPVILQLLLAWSDHYHPFVFVVLRITGLEVLS
jgi:hypothetical protein